MGRSRWGSFFEGQPTGFSLSTADARAVSKPAQTDVQLLRGESGWTNLGEVL
jgi:hypothetical protein